jgi:glycosyltransferase involved in cell wall biosynthesis
VRVAIDGRPVRFPLAGVGQYVANLILALAELEAAELDVAPLLFDNRWRGNGDARRLANRLANGAATVHHVMPRRLMTGWLRFAPGTVPRGLLGGSFDIWHATYFEGYPRLKRGQGLVVTVHDVIFLSRPDVFSARNLAASRFAAARQMRDAAVVIAVSQHTKRELLGHFDIAPDRVMVVPLAVRHPNPERVSSERSDNGGLDRPYVLYVGNLEPRKDIPTLIEAWLRSAARHDFALVLAGAPAYMSEGSIAAVRAASAAADVRWLGYVSEQEKHRLLGGATAFVYPSIYEGFGIPVLEALAYGVPVIACDTSSIPEVAGPGAVLVPPSDPSELARAIDRVAASSALRASMGQRGREHASAFTWDRVARETVAAYRMANQTG